MKGFQTWRTLISKGDPLDGSLLHYICHLFMSVGKRFFLRKGVICYKNIQKIPNYRRCFEKTLSKHIYICYYYGNYRENFIITLVKLYYTITLHSIKTKSIV